MQKIKFDFEAKKEIINVSPDASVPIGAPVNENGILANDNTAYGVVLDAQGVGVHRQLVVMVAGYCDIIDAQNIWGGEYSAEAIAAMSDIVFCDNHMIPGGSDPVLANAKSTGGIGWTESGEQVLYDGDLLINTPAFDSGAVFSLIDIDNLEVGETYKVVWNGDEYACNCIDLGGELVYLGNASIIGVPIATDYPFVFAVEEGAVGVATMSAGTYSIKLSKNGETVHQIDEKYLPASSGAMLVEFALDVSGDEPTVICDKTPEEVVALSAESLVFGVLKGAEEGEDWQQALGVFTIIYASVGESPSYDLCCGFTPFIGGNGNGKFLVGATRAGGWEYNSL